MSGKEMNLNVLKSMLSHKKLVCPGCWHAYTNFSDLKKHLGLAKDAEAHEGLLQVADTCHRKRDQEDAFGRDQFAEKKASGIANHLEAMLDIYLKIAVTSGMKYVCPQCVTQSFQYFNKIHEFHDHCRMKGDTMHLSLLRNNDETFLPFYLTAMGLPKIDKPPPGSDKRGPRTTSPYMQTIYVMKEKNFLARSSCLSE